MPGKRNLPEASEVPAGSKRNSAVKAVIVGGSIGGLSAAVALRRTGWQVVVLERSKGFHPAGAGLGLDATTCQLIADIGFAEQLEAATLPIPLEEYRWVDSTKPLSERRAVQLVVDEKSMHRSAHWADLRTLFYDALPPGTVHYDHEMVAFEQDEAGVLVTARTRGLCGGTQEFQFRGDILVDASGCNSTIRKAFIPDEKRRYSGMLAWRGVVDGNENPELMAQLEAEYKHLGNGNTFDIATSSMGLVHKLPNNRVNWLWYRDSAEPNLPGYSVTVRTTPADISQLHRDAEATWTPAFANLIKATKNTFVNAIYDKEPIKRWAFGRVVLIGEAAHPTTPHGSRSTNMSLQDSVQLGLCLRACQHEVLAALRLFEMQRIPVTTQEVLFSRHVGEIRQGRWFDPVTFNWPEQGEAIKKLLLNARCREQDYLTCAMRELSQTAITTKQASGPACVPFYSVYWYYYT